MSETFPHQARAGHPDDVQTDDVQTDDAPALHVASTVDVSEQATRAARVEAVLRRGDIRDVAAERRDRAAEGRATEAGDGAWTDRDWSGRDRDEAAIDRADLIEALKHHDPNA